MEKGVWVDEDFGFDVGLEVGGRWIWLRVGDLYGSDVG